MSKDLNPQEALSQRLDSALESVQESLWANEDVVESMDSSDIRDALASMGLSSVEMFEKLAPLLPPSVHQDASTANEEVHSSCSLEGRQETSTTPTQRVQEPNIEEPKPTPDRETRKPASFATKLWKPLAIVMTLFICVIGASSQYFFVRKSQTRRSYEVPSIPPAAVLVRKGKPRPEYQRPTGPKPKPQGATNGTVLPSQGQTNDGTPTIGYTAQTKAVRSGYWKSLKPKIGQSRNFQDKWESGSNTLGKDGKVQVTELSDYQCPHCKNGEKHQRSQGRLQPDQGKGRPVPSLLPGAPRLDDNKSVAQKTQGDGEKRVGKGEDLNPKPNKAKTKDPRVWRRTAHNTILSKVSVGGSKFLKLHKMQITVQVSGLRARTVLDHIYYNPYGRTLQGTFKYTLPAEASVSYYAMFVGTQRQRAPRFFLAGKGPRALRGLLDPKQLAKQVPPVDWGKLREARLVAAAQGRKVYEDITRRRIDPALLEQDAPNTFRGRVFPIPSKGYNRIIIAYEHTLPRAGNNLVYRLPFSPDVAESIDLSLGYNDQAATLTSHNLRKIRCKGLSRKASPLVRCMWEQQKPDRDAVFFFRPKSPNVSWVAGTDPTDNQKYMMARLRVQLPRSKQPYSSPQAVFLLDTSLSETPDLFAAHVALLQRILEKNQSHLKRFNVLFFDIGSQWAKPKGWIDNTPANRRALFQRIDSLLLEGATDIGRALSTLAKPSWPIQQGVPLDVFVLSDGQHNWGTSSIVRAMKQFQKAKPFGQVRFFAYRMGLGTEHTRLLHSIARFGGGVFPCLGRSELSRCATAHTQASMQLESVTLDGIGASEVLVHGHQLQLYPDSLLTVAARYQRDGVATAKLTGFFRGKRRTITQRFSVKATGDLAPRAWAEIAVSQLMELQKPKLVPLIVAYSQHFKLPNRHSSFLVLETDKEYKQYGLDTIKQTKQVKDVAQFVKKQRSQKKVTEEPLRRWRNAIALGMRYTRLKQQKQSRRIQMIRSILQQLSRHNIPSSQGMKGMRLWLKQDVSKKYQQTLHQTGAGFALFVDEAKRRLPQSLYGALRSLSCIVEQNPSHPQALRLVGYHLMAWKRYDEAAHVFLKLLERRPFEPHTYRDLARALARSHHWGLAAALYELILAGKWDNRFGQLRTIAREEYALLVNEALQRRTLPASLMMLFLRRKALLGLHVKPSKLRVTVTWNTDNTDIDLWVLEPNGETCKYNHRRTRNGGVLLQDITQGYGPERYENQTGKPGIYQIKLNFYGHSSNVFGNQTHATVVIVTHAGTPQQRTIVKNIVLNKKSVTHTVMKVKLE
ncbi:MAG: hypothetical protein EP343_34560 [Deltaproteobacteria bacterium]|nr:MAG: hypothetical protein EP343_34560 [Deltaproteobacteria bacterium]